MANIDQNAEVGLELTTTGLRLTGKVLIGIMNLFLNSDDKKDMYKKNDTKKGKQDIKNLLEKYDDGIDTLPDNVSKEEINNIKKELNEMGIDFSIKKIGKDNYSLFFSGKDREAIEKGMENSVSKHLNKEAKKEKVKETGKKIKDKVKPIFDINNMKNKHKENKKKERTQKKEKKKDKKKERKL